MKEYHKIQSIYKRDEKTHKFIEGQFSLPEFEYLKNNEWEFTEKVDGTNVRIYWDKKVVKIGGKTDNAQMPIFLLEKLQSIFTIEKFNLLYPDIEMCLYGEGYGAKIQKAGGNYNPNGVDFVLFDVLIGDFWLKKEDVVDIAIKLGIQLIPIIGYGTIDNAIYECKKGFKSNWGNFIAEGMVLRPKIEIRNRQNHRIITKVKYKDFH